MDEDPQPPSEPSPQNPDIPATVPTHLDNADWISFGATAIIALALYSLTLAPEVTLEFSGIASTSAAYAGVPHPPGYPVWTIYSWIFTKILPFSNVGWRVAFGQAVAAAFASGLVALIVSTGGDALIGDSASGKTLKPRESGALRIIAGFVAGMSLALSQPLWRMAVIAEFWAFSSLLFAVVVFLLVRWILFPPHRQLLYAALFVFGLLLTGNQEFTICIPALLAILLLGNSELGRDIALPIGLGMIAAWVRCEFGKPVWFLANYMRENLWLLIAVLTVTAWAGVIVLKTRRFGTEWKSALLCICAPLLGLAACFYLPIASMTTPPADWSYPRTIEGFVHLVTRGQYEPPNPTQSLSQLLPQLWLTLKLTAEGYGWPYLVLGLAPILAFPRCSRATKRLLIALTALLVCTGPLMVALLNPTPELATQQLIQSYFIAMEVVLAIGSGLAVIIIGSSLARRDRKHLG